MPDETKQGEPFVFQRGEYYITLSQVQAILRNHYRRLIKAHDKAIKRKDLEREFELDEQLLAVTQIGNDFYIDLTADYLESKHQLEESHD